MLDAKIASLLGTESSRIPSSRRWSVSRKQKVQKKKIGFFEEGRSPSWSTTFFRVTGAHGTVLDYADLFSVTLHDDNIQEFDTRRDEVLLCQNFHLMITWKVCTNLRTRESEKLKNRTEIVRHGDSSEDIDAHISKMKTMVGELQMRNSDYATLTPGTGELKQEQWSRIEREPFSCKEEK